MTDKNWGKTVLGWFVVADEEIAAPGGVHGAGSAKSTDPADALIAKYAQEPKPTVKPLAGPLPPVVDGNVDFGKVYEAAGHKSEERNRVERAQELLRSLPGDTPAATKKQIVEASLKAFNVPTDKIIESAVSQIETLQRYIVTGQTETQRQLTDGGQRIAKLEAEIEAIKQGMQKSLGDQQNRVTATNSEKLKIQQVLEFFGREAVAKVVQDSARLTPPAPREGKV